MCCPTTLLFAILMAVLWQLPEAQSPTYPQKLMMIWAEPTEYSNDYEVYDSWDHCTSICFYNDNCIMISENRNDDGQQCRVFLRGQVRTFKMLGAEDKKVLGLRRVMVEDNCPSSGIAPLFGLSTVTDVVKGENVIFTNTFSQIGSDISMQYEDMSCPEGSKMFDRNGIMVCVNVLTFNKRTYGNWNDARTLCAEQGAILTGPHNPAEYEWMKEKAVIAAVISKERLGTTFFWIDGRSESSVTSFQMLDATHGSTGWYPWNRTFDKIHGGGNCLLMMWGAQLQIISFDCTASYNQSPLYFWKGAACMFQPLLRMF